MTLSLSFLFPTHIALCESLSVNASTYKLCTFRPVPARNGGSKLIEHSTWAWLKRVVNNNAYRSLSGFRKFPLSPAFHLLNDTTIINGGNFQERIDSMMEIEGDQLSQDIFGERRKEILQPRIKKEVKIPEDLFLGSFLPNPNILCLGSFFIPNPNIPGTSQFRPSTKVHINYYPRRFITKKKNPSENIK